MKDGEARPCPWAGYFAERASFRAGLPDFRTLLVAGILPRRARGHQPIFRSENGAQAVYRCGAQRDLERNSRYADN